MPVHPRIEVFGLCGAGKSTVVARLLPLIAARTGTAICATRPTAPRGPQSLGRTGRLVAGAGLRNPWALAAFLRHPSNWWLPLKLGYRRAALANLADDQAHILLDSGVLQPFISFVIEWCRRPDQAVPLAGLLPALPKTTAALHIHAPAETAMQRYRARARETGITLDQRDWNRHFAAGASMTDAIATACRARRCPVVTIDNTQAPSPTDLANAVDALLAQLPGTQPPS